MLPDVRVELVVQSSYVRASVGVGLGRIDGRGSRVDRPRRVRRWGWRASSREVTEVGGRNVVERRKGRSAKTRQTQAQMGAQFFFCAADRPGRPCPAPSVPAGDGETGWWAGRWCLLTVPNLWLHMWDARWYKQQFGARTPRSVLPSTKKLAASGPLRGLALSGRLRQVQEFSGGDPSLAFPEQSLYCGLTVRRARGWRRVSPRLRSHHLLQSGISRVEV